MRRDCMTDFVMASHQFEVDIDDDTGHVWSKQSAALSGDWRCVLCGHMVTGGPHDGKGYYPGRGQKIGDCQGVVKIAKLIKRIVDEMRKCPRRNC